MLVTAASEPVASLLHGREEELPEDAVVDEELEGEAPEVDEDGVRRHAAAHLAAFKVPELVEFTDSPLPRNPAGKLLKDGLRGRGSGAFDPALLG